MICDVRDFLYLINCYGCNTAQYIGESGDTLTKTQHRHIAIKFYILIYGTLKETVSQQTHLPSCNC